MRLTQIERTDPRHDALCDWAESPQSNYDGVACKPFQFVECPYCHEPAVIVYTHNGGYPNHHGWRCKANACVVPSVEGVSRWAAQLWV